jgi:hypothetical protein
MSHPAPCTFVSFLLPSMTLTSWGPTSNGKRTTLICRPYYELHVAMYNSPLDSNWHKIPIAQEELTVEIPATYLDNHPLPLPSAWLVVFFEDKLLRMVSLLCNKAQF